MTIEQLSALASAGFTKQDIIALCNSSAPAVTPAPAPAPAAAPAPAQAPAPAPAPAVMNTPVHQMPTGLQGFGNPINPVQGRQEQFYNEVLSRNGQQMNIDMGNGGVVKNNDPLIETINNLTRAVQANGIANSQMPENKQPTVDDMLAEIIRPTSGQNGGK